MVPQLTANSPPVRDSPVRKALRLLKLLLEADAARNLQELSRGTGINTSTAHRLLRMLSEESFVDFDEKSKVYSAVLPNASAFGATSGINIQDDLDALAQFTGETVGFNGLNTGRDHMTLLAVSRSPNPLGYELELGRVDPLHAGASGKAILSAFGLEDFDRYIERATLSTLTSRTLTDSAKLRADVEQVRSTGFALSKGERIDGAVGLAVPAKNAHCVVTGSLVVTVPEFRFEESKVDALVHQLHKAAQTLFEQS